MCIEKLKINNWTNWHHIIHKHILHEENFIPKNINILIAVSGGQDSMALLTLMNDIKSQYGWSIFVWHGDHQWHKNSSRFAYELQEYCSKKNIPFYLDSAEDVDISSEEKAREWRYKTLCENAEKIESTKIQKKETYLITGHTSTDSAETFLLNLARGSDFKGLGSIRKKSLLNSKYYLVRPILIFNRSETAEICKSMKIPTWEDPSNLDLKIRRNLIRKKVIPELEKIYPGCSKRINNLSEKMINYSNQQTDLTRLALISCSETNGVNRKKLNQLCRDARISILNALLIDYCSKRLSSRNIKNLSLLILKENNGKIDLPGKKIISWDKNYIRITSKLSC